MLGRSPTGDPPIVHHMATANGVKVHYTIAAVDETVVLLHGWPQTWYEWRRIISTLAAH